MKEENEKNSNEEVEEVKTTENKNENEEVQSNEKTNTLKSYISIIVAILFVIAICLCIRVFTTKPEIGNSIGNIRNYGYTAEKDNSIYYIAPTEDNSKIGIYKVNSNGDNSKELLSQDGDIISLNAYGDYLYFINIGSENYKEDDELDNKICRVKIDGTNLETINDNEFSNDCYEIYVVRDSVYYIGIDNNIYKMNLDGSNKEIVSKNGTGYLGVTDQYIIYNVDIQNEETTDYITYIMNLDGSNAHPIIENTRLYSVGVENNYIYYTNEQKQICTVKMDGTEEKTLYEVTAYNMNLSNGYIYYLNYVDAENSDYTVCIYRVKADGTSEKPEIIKELDTYSDFVNIVGNWVAFDDRNDTTASINLVKKDGEGTVKQIYLLDYSTYTEQQQQTEVVEESVTDTDTNTTVENTISDNANENTNVIQ